MTSYVNSMDLRGVYVTVPADELARLVIVCDMMAGPHQDLEDLWSRIVAAHRATRTAQEAPQGSSATPVAPTPMKAPRRLS